MVGASFVRNGFFTNHKKLFRFLLSIFEHRYKSKKNIPRIRKNVNAGGTPGTPCFTLGVWGGNMILFEFFILCLVTGWGWRGVFSVFFILFLAAGGA